MSEALDLLIIGAGFSGLAMAIRADRDGFSRFLILEKSAAIGGTWHDNTYPGAASDIPSHLYSLSFAPNADWSRLYPRQPEIEAYLRDLVSEHGLTGRLRLGTKVTTARWDEEAGLWRVETDRGDYTARVLVSGAGGLHHPALPNIPGLDGFAGPAFHSARWDHGCDLTGRRVGVIGTGASAVQIVPEIVARVARLTLFQRSAPWVLPRGDRAYTERERKIFARVPLARQLHRAKLYWQHEIVALLGFAKISRVTAIGETLGRRHIARAVNDETLRRTLTPTYRLGCKRVLVSDDYYPALTRANVAVVTEPIRAVGPHGVVTADGTEHLLDVLILATGFDVEGGFARIRIVGRGGVALSEAWRSGMDAYQGLAVHGFPNFFLLLGPNTALGHNSVLLMIEAQVAHVLDALRHLSHHPGRVLEVNLEAQTAFREKVDARMADSIWMRGGCGSWYLDGSGRNRTIWPGSVPAYRRGARRMRLADYETRQFGDRSP
ncbi:flavin-containing monooxygenase [Methylobacterium haplocladii]|uniref:4-hydroxyacetophenone monooxygenase n=1 Tax=Methylobacterium haplocladii TaxID=1176176 RepID=A0A512IUE0_9HYPH|nr:NAD(P)/FAD-dependent oxidoreductase [Methylobacterium haplocladii]GEP01320.1 4-hydroxyacetophenone monooxygenase [Methylobacterium haplocladii]GJD83864.1 Baeyer-Villiger monooxygenase [Methylobacterium haplocladii]GLS59977.1 4-hydroxyacetophenone monooxygenase [Methylobacterium haplocladii]